MKIWYQVSSSNFHYKEIMKLLPGLWANAHTFSFAFTFWWRADHYQHVLFNKLVMVSMSLLSFSKNLLEVYRESVNLIGYITRRLSPDSLQL